MSDKSKKSFVRLVQSVERAPGGLWPILGEKMPDPICAAGDTVRFHVFFSVFGVPKRKPHRIQVGIKTIRVDDVLGHLEGADEELRNMTPDEEREFKAALESQPPRITLTTGETSNHLGELHGSYPQTLNGPIAGVYSVVVLLNNIERVQCEYTVGPSV